MLKQAGQTLLQRGLAMQALKSISVESLLPKAESGPWAGSARRCLATEAVPAPKPKIQGPPDLYVFLATKWQFDEVYNQQVAKRVMDMGADTWLVLDKGFLEAVGPRGVAQTLLPAASKVRRINTGVVHDYAVVYKVVALAGVTSLFLPGDFLGRASGAVILPLLLISLM